MAMLPLRKSEAAKAEAARARSLQDKAVRERQVAGNAAERDRKAAKQAREEGELVAEAK